MWKSWKTTTAGIFTILAAIATPILPVVGVPAALATAICSALGAAATAAGLMAAKDHDVTGSPDKP